MTFIKQSDSYKPFSTPSGSPVKTKYARRTTEYGDTFLVEVGSVNLDEMIQSYAKECDINYLVDRYAKGDTMALQKAQGVYCDSLGMPQNLADTFRIMENAKTVFGRLPGHVSAKFSDLNDFLSCFGSAAGLDRLNDAFGIVNSGGVK